MKSLATLCLVVTILMSLLGCDDSTYKPQSPSAPRVAADSEVQKVTKQEPSPENTVAIPQDVTYSVTSDTTLRNIKRVIDVRLNKRVGEDVLEAIAYTLRDSDPTRYERTFIFYNLPDKQDGYAAWATSHFNPDLDVQILGLTNEQIEPLSTIDSDDYRDMIGVWLDERPLVGHRMILYRKDGGVFLERTYPDGSTGVFEITEQQMHNGVKYVEYVSSLGDHYLLNADGNLELRDNDGLISIASSLPSKNYAK